MTNQTKINNFNYLIDPPFNKAKNILSHHLKTKKIENLFQNITHQQLK